jgi:hypothetical protein
MHTNLEKKKERNRERENTGKKAANRPMGYRPMYPTHAGSMNGTPHPGKRNGLFPFCVLPIIL